MARIDILLATYNGEKYLDSLLSSIESQTFSDWRILISDDGSTDKTLDKIREWQRHSNRISLVKSGNPSGSARANFMNLLSYSNADYLAFCDQDDVWHPDKLVKCLEEMLKLENQQETSSKPFLVFSDARVVDSNLNPIDDSFIRYSGLDSSRTQLNHLLVQNIAPGCTMLLNRSLVTLLSQASHSSKVYMHDWWAMLIASALGSIAYINEPLIDYRQHNDNSVGATSYSLSLIPFWLNRLDEMVDYFKALMLQGEEFNKYYGNQLTSEQSQLLQSFSNLSQNGPVGRFSNVTKHKLWKNRLMLCVGEAYCLLKI